MQISPNPDPTVAQRKAAPKAPAGVKTDGISASVPKQRSAVDRSNPKGTRARPKTRSVANGRPIVGSTKQDRVLAMLRSKGGVSIAAVMKATGWQRHSVHGFFAGVVRKKLGLRLRTDGSGTKRVYRIGAGRRATAAKSKRRTTR